MKKTALLLISGVLFIFSSSALADDLELPHVAVYGTARKMIVPDRAVWSLNVKNTGIVLKEVADVHSDRVSAVIGYLRKMKIEEEDIQTSRMQFGENWKYRKGTRVGEGYFASTDIAFKLKEIDRYESVWMGLAEMKTLSVRGVHFEISDRKTYQRDLHAEALLEARRKATAMARTLGVEIGGPLRIEEITAADTLPLRKQRTMEAASLEAAGPGEGTAVAPGRIPVHSAVKVVFQIIDTSR